MARETPGNFICDFSGFKYPLSEAVKNWDGHLVHHRFADRRNPQDFLRTPPDRQMLPVARPEAPDVFLSPGDVTPEDL